MIEVNDSNFYAEVIDSKIPVLVDFWADWCAPCKAMMPSLRAISIERSDVKIVKFLSDKNSERVRQYGIRTVPSLLLFENGAIVASKTGPQSKDALNAFLDLNLKNEE